MPVGAKSEKEAVRMGSETFHNLRTRCLTGTRDTEYERR